MSKELRNLKKDYKNLTKDEIFEQVRTLRSKLETKSNIKFVSDFSNLLVQLIEHFSSLKDINSERILLNQIIELAWYDKTFEKNLNSLTKAIFTILRDSQLIQGQNRLDIFRDFVEILVRFPKNKIIYDAISRAAIELIKWGTDEELLDIIELIKEKSVVYTLLPAIQVLEAKVYMNVLFYLDNQDCKAISKIYSDFSCFSISAYDDLDKFSGECIISGKILGEDINEILQEGAINAIINLCRVNKKHEEKCEDCILGIRRILQDSEYLLRKDDKVFFKDLYRLSYTFDIYELWNEFLDLPIVKELLEEKEKIQAYEQAKTKLLAIQKYMRIEEYDALKIGRRGIKLAYDFNSLEDLKQLHEDIINSFDSQKPVNLVEEIDAVIEIDDDIKNHLRETGQIPMDKKTVDELQDLTSLNDDLTLPATKESSIKEQLEFLGKLEITDDKFLMNHMLHAKALIFSVGMFGFNTKLLNITIEEFTEHINILTEKKMIHELIHPLVRAVTLRAARLDYESTIFLFKLLNKKGLKFISRYYKQLNFIQNLIRLISFLSREGEIKKLNILKEELEKANNICLKDETIANNIARAINEGILVNNLEKPTNGLKLLEILQDLARRNSFNSYIQIKLAEAYSFNILFLGYHNLEASRSCAYQLLNLSKEYSKNEQIAENVVLGLYWALLVVKLNGISEDITLLSNEIIEISEKFPENNYIQKILSFI